MNVQHHITDSGPGIVGSTVAGGFTVMGFISNVIPVLQVLSLILGMAVAVVTFLYYYNKVRAQDLEAAAVIAAKAIEAKATVIAAALSKTEP
jgi:hypothetical protein